MSMNVRKRYPGKGRTPEVLADIARIPAIWAGAKGYMDAMLALPAMREWIEAAEREPESIAELDLYE